MTIYASNGTEPYHWPWKFFTPAEFRCKGSGILMVEGEFLDRLTSLRLAFGKPMPVNSGYRTPEHNARSSNTGLTGPHTTGRAADIAITTSADRFLLVSLALTEGFTGVGIAKTFVHLDDVAPGHRDIARPMLWLY